MKALKEIYLNTLEALGEMPSLKKDWRWVFLYSIAIYAIVLAFRMSFAGRWDHPELWAAGERILATHDAYFWLALAKGVGFINAYPLAGVVKWFHEVFGIGYGTLAFWSPAVMGALVGVVCFLWGWLLAGRNAGIFVGIVGALTPGFYYRSRLGYFDTDMFTLLMPMLVAWLLAYWSARYMRRGWFAQEIEHDASQGDATALWMAFGFGLFNRVAGIWHQDIINLCMLYFLFAIPVLALGGKRGKRRQAFLGLTVYLLAAFPGVSYGLWGFWPLTYLPRGLMGLTPSTLYSIAGIGLSALLVIWANRSWRVGSKWVDNPYVCIGLLIVFIMMSGLAHNAILPILQKFSGYFFPTQVVGEAAEGVATGPLFPAIVQSIIEAKLIPLSVVLERGVFASWLGWLAIGCSVGVVMLRPVSIFLLPFIALQLLSVKMGVRFTMFGGAALVICLGVLFYWTIDSFLRKSGKRTLVAICTQVLLSVSVLAYCHSAYSALPLTPVVLKGHAEALVELGEQAPKDSVLWAWWDWGYISQYYTGLKTVVDGGNHAGRDVFPVAYAMSTDQPEKARQMIALTAQFPRTYSTEPLYSPYQSWTGVKRDEIMQTLDRQLQENNRLTNKQYLAVSWNDLTLSKWITHFGNWNLETGSTREATVNSFEPGELGIQMERGAVMTRRGSGGLVSDISVLTKSGIDFKEFYLNRLSPQLLPKRRHLLINKVSGQSVLMDRIGYRSTMRQLLTGDPNDPEISKYFKLVVEKLPFVRIYEVVQ